MLKKYIFVNKDSEVVVVIKLDGSILQQAALIAAFESDPTFVEVPVSNRATLGWHFDGENYVQNPI